MNLDEIKTKAKDASDNTMLMLVGEIERLNQKSQKLVEALKYYANRMNLKEDRFSGSDFIEVTEFGNKARQALKEWEA